MIDATGLMLCPGFINMHAHTALESFRDPQLEPKVAEGFTTEVIKPVGLAPAPVAEDGRHERQTYLRSLEGPESRPMISSTTRIPSLIVYADTMIIHAGASRGDPAPSNSQHGAW